MGGGLLFIGFGALFAFYGMRFIRDKSTNYRFTKALTLLGLTMVCWGTFPQAQRFNSGTQIFAQLIVGLLFFGVGGAVVGFLIDWYRKQNKDLNPASDHRSLQGGELGSKEQTSSGSTSQLNRTKQSENGISAADLVRLEQITSLRDRGTLSQSQFEAERNIILGDTELISQDADAAPEISPQAPTPTLRDDAASGSTRTYERAQANRLADNSEIGVEALTELVKDRKYLAGVFLVYVMFWIVLSDLNFFCDTCDRINSFSALFTDLQHPILPVSIICVLSTIFSFFAHKFFMKNLFYKLFYLINIVLSLTLIYIIF